MGLITKRRMIINKDHGRNPMAEPSTAMLDAGGRRIMPDSVGCCPMLRTTYSYVPVWSMDGILHGF